MNPGTDFASPNCSIPRTKVASVHPNSSQSRRESGNASRDVTLPFSGSIDEMKPVEHFTNHPEPTSPQRRPSRDSSIQTASSSIHETKAIVDLPDQETEPLHPLKSCISAPNLSGMATTMKRNVSFHKIEIREYERTIGDNPCVSSGPPLSLDWKYNPDHGVFDVEEYEQAKKPRTKAEMLMPKELREVILKEHWDVSRNEMQSAVKEVNIIRRNRRTTARSTRAAEKKHEQLERVSRKVKRIVSLGKRRDEQKLWKDVKTMCGKRVYSMNDLAAYNATAALVKAQDDCLPVIGSLSKQPDFASQDSLSSESATSLPVVPLDDDDWGFGYDDDAD